MREASLIKFYFVRFFFLAFALMQAVAAVVLLVQYEDTPKSRFAIFVLFSLAMILISIHTLVFSNLKRVAVGKKKITVAHRKKLKHYEWEEVKELKHLAFFNLYSLHLKGKKKKIYFLPFHDSEAVFGLFGDNLEWMGKK
ncbi:MAG: hypothetical protein OJF59_001153 [Cytophagales bacterium]|jgi:hypothetical protein|nr:MAG: hypothetical protein OJF59_001153 [Cytophagales bacterium]